MWLHPSLPLGSILTMVLLSDLSLALPLVSPTSDIPVPAAPSLPFLPQTHPSPSYQMPAMPFCVSTLFL